MYAAVITRVEEELDDELTGGWKIVEVMLLLLISDLLLIHPLSDGSSLCTSISLISTDVLYLLCLRFGLVSQNTPLSPFYPIAHTLFRRRSYLMPFMPAQSLERHPGFPARK
jgi:hypothetical protein